MKKMLRRRPSPSMAVALVALALAAGGVAYAAIPDSSGVIHGCYNTKGALRVIDTEASPPQTCGSRETALDWPGVGAASGKGVLSAVVRLSTGETKTVLQKGPFTLTARCADLGASGLQATTTFQSSEADTVFGSVTLAANASQAYISSSGTGESWNWGPVHIAAPSGATWALFVSAGVHTFTSDCAVAATASG